MGLERDQRGRVQRRGIDSHRAVIVLLLAVLAGLTVTQHRVWRSNLTLWTHATRVHPQLARPAINLGLAYWKAGQPAQAAEAWITAGPLLHGDPREAEYRRVLARSFGLLEMFGTFVCDAPTARPYC